MYTLRIVIVGLVAFVPQYDEDSSQLDRVWALFADADYEVTRNNTVKNEGEFPPCIKLYSPDDPAADYPQHYSALKISARNILGGTFTTRGDTVIWPIGENDIKFLIDGPKGTPQLQGGRGMDRDGQPSEQPATETEAMDFTWIPRISNFIKNPDRGTVHPNCLIADPSQIDPRLCGISARLVIEKGVIRTSFIRKAPNGKYKTFKFYDNKSEYSSSYRQSMAEEVEWLIHDLENPVRMVMKDFHDGDPQIIDIAPSYGEDEVVIQLVNQIGGSLADPNWQHIGQLHSFRWFYKLSKTKAGPQDDCDGPYPIPMEVKTTAGDPRCPLAILDPPTD